MYIYMYIHPLILHIFTRSPMLWRCMIRSHDERPFKDIITPSKKQLFFTVYPKVKTIPHII